MTGFRFQDPVWCLLLVPLFLAVLLAVRRQRRCAVLYSSVQVLKTLPVTWALVVKRVLPWIRFLGLALVILALARPQQGREAFRIRTEGIAIEMAIDRSGSMQALDFEINGKRVNRLEIVKKVFREFVTGGEDLPGRPDDLIGLVAFGGYADSKCPLTLDHGALLQVLDTVEIPRPVTNARGEMINAALLKEEQMTAIGDALALAVKRLEDVKAKSRIVILLSDGENTAGAIQPEEAARAAAAEGVKVYTIGVGSTGEVPVRGTDMFGRPVLRPMHVTLDEATLKMLAETTGGRYFNARDTETLKRVYGEIDRLEKTESEGRLYTEYRELFTWALYPGLVLILLELLLGGTRFRSLP